MDTATERHELSAVIAGAARRAFAELFEEVDEDFYYCTLTTTGEGLRPAASAWSWQALDRVAATYADPGGAREWLKWSYADSPYSIIGDEYFAEVTGAFADRPNPHDLDQAEFVREAQFRIGAMEAAMRHLDGEGVFGTGDARRALVILVEVVPPDSTNTERAVRLNPQGGPALDMWLDEAAED